VFVNEAFFMGQGNDKLLRAPIPCVGHWSDASFPDPDPQLTGLLQAQRCVEFPSHHVNQVDCSKRVIPMIASLAVSISIGRGFRAAE
jgi:hypothetical protein